tara:strand:- start:919 stop:1107 length:189 start_codon:yes stop_codon:yes gene_type:complete
MAEKKQGAVRNPNHFIKINQLKKKRKEASEKPRNGRLKKRTVRTGTGRQGAGPFPFKKGGRS